MPDKKIKRFFLLPLKQTTFTGILISLLTVSPALAQQEQAAAPLSASHDGFNIQLSAIPPDRIRAFFTGRGFPADMVAAIAEYCVISTRIENNGTTAFSYDLTKWRYETTDGKLHKLKIKDDWIKEWREQGIKFSFSQLAANPTFLPGDWIASMTTYRLPYGTRFNLHYQWNVDGKDNTGIIKGVQCAND